MEEHPHIVEKPRKRKLLRIAVSIAAISFCMLLLNSMKACACFSGGYSFKAKQAEAKVNLHHLYNAQEVYYLENNHYGTMADLGINLDFEKNYSIKMELYHDKKNYSAIASSGRGSDNGIDKGCPAADIWLIDNTGELREIPDLVTSQPFQSCIADN